MDESFSARFARRLRRRREVMGFSGVYVAEQIKITQSQYSGLEHGKQQGMRLEKLAALVSLLKTSADYLLGLSDDQGDIPPDLSPAEVPSLPATTPLPTATAGEDAPALA